MVYQRTSSDKKFYAGVQGENLAIVVMFPIVGWKDKYGEGTFKGLFSRPGEKAAYYVDITNDDKYVYWSPREEDMYYDGVAQFQLQYEVDDVIAKMHQLNLFTKLSKFEGDFKFKFKIRLFLLNPKIYYKIWRKVKNSID